MATRQQDGISLFPRKTLSGSETRDELQHASLIKKNFFPLQRTFPKGL
jgi:hypothetical protein